MRWPSAEIAEAYRCLRLNLERGEAGQPTQVLLLTAPAPDAGTPAVAAGLAFAFAEAGQRTLLVDAGREQPTLHALFGLPDAPGLGALAEAPAAPLAGLLQETRVPGLWLLAGGPPGSASRPLPWAALMQSLREQAERVICYAPSTERSETLALARHVDGVLLLARRHRTRRGALREARARLEAVGAPVRGVVLWE